MEGDDLQALSTEVLDSLPVSVAIVDTDGVIVWTDRSWREFSAANAGADADDVGVNYLEVTEVGDDEFAREAARGLRLVTSGERDDFELEYPCHGPEEKRWFKMWVAGFVQDGRRYAVVAHFDVTERVQRERDLSELNEKLDAVIEASPEAITVEDADGVVRLWNEGAEETFGWTEAEVVGEPNPSVPEWVREAYEADFKRVLDGDVIDGVESVRQHRDGTEFPVTVSAAPVRDADGQIIAVMAVVRDITERKRREERLERTNTQLEALNSVLQHDIRNDMQVILAWTEMLADHVDAEGQELLDKVARSGEHVVELTQTASELVEATVDGDVEETTEPVALAPVLESELAKRREMYPDATFEVDGTIPAVDVRASSMLSSVLGNLLNNAVQHNDRDRPTVTVGVAERDDVVTVSVADDGPGIPDALKDSVFGRGEKGLDSEGTGIGLYLVRQLVEGYGGSVAVSDNDPRGTVVTVDLPRADAGRCSSTDESEGKA